MISRNEPQETPDWQPDPQPRDYELERFIRVTRAAPEPLAENLVLGEN